MIDQVSIWWSIGGAIAGLVLATGSIAAGIYIGKAQAKREGFWDK